MKTIKKMRRSKRVDSEIDFIEDLNALGLYQDFKSGHYKYLLLSFYRTIKVKEHFSPPEVIH